MGKLRLSIVAFASCPLRFGLFVCSPPGREVERQPSISATRSFGMASRVPPGFVNARYGSEDGPSLRSAWPQNKKRRVGCAASSRRRRSVRGTCTTTRESEHTSVLAGRAAPHGRRACIATPEDFDGAPGGGLPSVSSESGVWLSRGAVEWTARAWVWSQSKSGLCHLGGL